MFDATKHKAEILNLSSQQLTRVDEALFGTGFVKTLDVSGNELCRLASIFPVASGLEALNASHNRISTLEALDKFRLLQSLDLSHNLIQRPPRFTSVHLQLLDLSSNQLFQLPDVSCLCQLRTLHLSCNKISSLESVPRFFPSSVVSLKLDWNCIDDLCQSVYLHCLESLESIWLSGNPALSKATGLGCDFRPYLVCCCPKLKVIDGFLVTDMEQLKGEWLYTQGRGRSFGAGDGTALCEYLSGVCSLPGSSDRLSTELEARLERVLEKRCRHRPQSELESVKENRVDVAVSRAHSKSVHLPLSPRQERLNPYELYDNRLACSLWSQFSPVSSQQRSMSRKNLRSLKRRPTCKKRVLEELTAPRSAFGEREALAATRIQSWWRGIGVRSRDAAVAKMYEQIRAKRLEEWAMAANSDSGKELGECRRVNSLLSDLAKKMAEDLEAVRRSVEESDAERRRWREESEGVQSRCSRLEAVVSALTPTPTNLRFLKQDADSGLLSWEVAWSPFSVQSYQLFVDEELCGEVSGRSTRALVADLDFSVSHTFRVRALGVLGGDVRDSPTLEILEQSESVSVLQSIDEADHWIKVEKDYEETWLQFYSNKT